MLVNSHEQIPWKVLQIWWKDNHCYLSNSNANAIANTTVNTIAKTIAITNANANEKAKVNASGVTNITWIHYVETK